MCSGYLRCNVRVCVCQHQLLAPGQSVAADQAQEVQHRLRPPGQHAEPGSGRHQLPDSLRSAQARSGLGDAGDSSDRDHRARVHQVDPGISTDPTRGPRLARHHDRSGVRHCALQGLLAETVGAAPGRPHRRQDPPLLRLQEEDNEPPQAGDGGHRSQSEVSILVLLMSSSFISSVSENGIVKRTEVISMHLMEGNVLFSAIFLFLQFFQENEKKCWVGF